MLNMDLHHIVYATFNRDADQLGLMTLISLHCIIKFGCARSASAEHTNLQKVLTSPQ